jgi:dolichol-phosphate mannosyltransferase
MPGPALVIIPTYNERENVTPLAAAVHAAAPELHLLFVDDNSPDGTGAALDALAAGDGRVSVLHRAGKLGLGTAYIDGFRWGLSRGYEYLVEMDADFSHDPNYLPEMLRRAEAGADVVVGSRYVPGGGTANWDAFRRMLSRGAAVYARAVLGFAVRDPTAGFVCYRRRVLERIDLAAVRSEGYGFQIEMKYRAIRAGFAVEEMPIVFEERRLGRSKMSWPIIVEALGLVWRLRMGRREGRGAARMEDGG